MPDFVRVTWRVKPTVRFKCAPKRPEFTEAEVYIDTAAGFAYLDGLKRFLSGKGIKIAPFAANNFYGKDVLVLAQAGTQVTGDCAVFYLSEDKAALWHFLKDRFKDRL